MGLFSCRFNDDGFTKDIFKEGAMGDDRNRGLCLKWGLKPSFHNLRYAYRGRVPSGARPSCPYAATSRSCRNHAGRTQSFLWFLFLPLAISIGPNPVLRKSGPGEDGSLVSNDRDTCSYIAEICEEFKDGRWHLSDGPPGRCRCRRRPRLCRSIPWPTSAASGNSGEAVLQPPALLAPFYTGMLRFKKKDVAMGTSGF
jgi:hypothetical protein